MAEARMSISEVLDTLSETADENNGNETSINVVMDAFGRRAYGPFLFVVGALSATPLGSIPGASILFSSFIIIMMVQYIARDGAPWIPGWISNRSISSKRVRQSAEAIKPYLERLECVVRARYHTLTHPPWTYVCAVSCILLALTMYPLALVPWGVLPPSLAIAFIGLGMMSSDGLLIAIGLAISVAAWVATALLLL